MNLLPACADREVDCESRVSSGIDMDQFKWKNRIILSYPRDDSEWEEQQELFKQQKTEIDDRDLVIIRVDGEYNNLEFTKAERQAVIKMHKLSPGSHLLIGKDGGAKRMQEGKLDLPLLFRLIDQMPMRRSEMNSSSHVLERVFPDEENSG